MRLAIDKVVVRVDGMVVSYTLTTLEKEGVYYMYMYVATCMCVNAKVSCEVCEIMDNRARIIHGGINYTMYM